MNSENATAIKKVVTAQKVAMMLIVISSTEIYKRLPNFGSNPSIILCGRKPFSIELAAVI
jgi:hypothetical protein